MDLVKLWTDLKEWDLLREDDDLPFYCFMCDDGFGLFKQFTKNSEGWFERRNEKLGLEKKERRESGELVDDVKTDDKPDKPSKSRRNSKNKGSIKVEEEDGNRGGESVFSRLGQKPPPTNR